MFVPQRPDVVVGTALIGSARVPIVAPPAALDGCRRKGGIDSVEVRYSNKIDGIVLIGRTYRLGILVAAKTPAVQFASEFRNGDFPRQSNRSRAGSASEIRVR